MLLKKINFQKHAMKDFFIKCTSKDFLIVLAVILVSKSIYYEALGMNLLLGLFFLLLLPLMPFKSLRKLCKFLIIHKFWILHRFVILYSFKSLRKIHGFFIHYKPVILYSMAFLFLILLNTGAQYSSVLVLVVRILISLFVIHLITFRKFSNMYIDIMTFLSIVSWLSLPVIFFKINSVLPDFIATDFRVLKNYIFFCVQNTNLEYGIWKGVINLQHFRSSGLWWEPGAFQLFVNTAVIFSLINNRLSLKRYCMFLITIIIIASTTGFIVFALLSIVYFKNNLISLGRFVMLLIPAFIYIAVPRWGYEKFKSGSLSYSSFSDRCNEVCICLDLKNNLILLGKFMVPLILTYIYIAPQIYRKFKLGSSFYPSFSDRYNDFYISLNMLYENLFLGYGFGSRNANDAVQALYKELDGSAGADGITMMVAQLGIFSMFLLIPFLIPKYYIHLDISSKFLISLSLLLMYNTQNFTFTLIFTLLTFYGIVGDKFSSKKCHDECKL